MIDKFAADIFKVLYYQTAMCVLVVDDGRIVRQCNPAICSILDRDAESLAGQTIDALTPIPIDEARYEGIRFQLDRDGSTTLIRHVFAKANGAHVQFMGRIFKVDTGMYFFIMFPDQKTEQIYETERLRRHSDGLVKQILDLERQVELLKNRKAFPVNVTPTERKVASLIAQGKTTEAIAWEIHRSVATVKNHRKSLRKKLNLEKGYSLSAVLREYGLL